jgi:transposase
MNHANPALSLKGRRELCRVVVERERTLRQAAEAADVSVRWASKWVGRYRAEGEAGLRDRSSAPYRIPHPTSEQRVEAIAALRRLRFTGPEIVEVLGMALSTVSGILARIGMGKLGRVGLEPAVRYERERPGELIHIDIKKLGRIERGAGARITGMANRGSRPRRTDALGVSRQIAGWEYVHIAIDDCTRLAYAEVLPDQRTSTVIGFLTRAVAFYARYGITVQQLLTDNGGAYRSTIHAIACRASLSAICAPAPTVPRPTARPSGSSELSPPAGPTERSTAPTQNAPLPLTDGSGTTTINDDTQLSATNRPSLASTSGTNLEGTYTYAGPAPSTDARAVPAAPLSPASAVCACPGERRAVGARPGGSQVGDRAV